MYKVFQKDVFDLHDDPARIAAKRFWNGLGYECQDNPDDFGEDLLVTGKGKKFYCEVEVKTIWHGTKFHFDSLHIPARKAKFLNRATKFMIFNASLTHAAIVSHSAVANAPLVEVKNIYIKQGERFFNVPLKDLHIVPVLNTKKPEGA